MKSNEVWIPFDPAPVDVVSTKLRTWNLSHPGNLYYTDLVNTNVVSLDKEDINEIKRRAEKIVYSITVERGGRFLRPPDGDTQPTTCVILDGKQALAKVVHALRTAQLRLDKADSAPPKKNGVGRPAKPKPTPVAKPSTQSPRPRSRRSSASDSLMYQAISKNKKIPQHTLNLITSVCNQLDAETAHRILDLPLEGQSLDNETDLERRMRLQLRHRFAAAAAIGMSPLEFASRLLKLWDGKLITTKRRPKPKPVKSPPEEGTSTIANSVPSTTLHTPTTISLSPQIPSCLDGQEGQIIPGTTGTFSQSSTPILEPAAAAPLALESNASLAEALHEKKHDNSDVPTDQTLPAHVPSNESSN